MKSRYALGEESWTTREMATAAPVGAVGEP
jgi:hypothetical protein